MCVQIHIYLVSVIDEFNVAQIVLRPVLLQRHVDALDICLYLYIYMYVYIVYIYTPCPHS